MTVESRVKTIVESHLGVELDESKLNNYELGNDLGADSLDAIELVMIVEDEFDISMSDDEAMSIVTVGDLIQAINNNLS